MGQAKSLEALQRSISKDLSDRVLVLHGLFHSPYPLGSHLLCEVDLKDVDDLNEYWNDENAKIVIQVISYQPNGEIESCLSGKSRHLDLNICEVEPEVKSQAIWSPSAKVEPDQYNKVQAQLQTKSEENPSEVLNSNSLEGSSSKSTTANEVSVPKAKEKVLVEKLLSALAPEISVIPASYEALKDLVSSAMSKLNREGTEDSILGCRYKASSSQKHARLKGSFRHPNIVPIVGAFQGENLYIVYPSATYTLETVLHFSPGALQDDGQIRLLAFQLLSALAHCHSLGLAHGNLKPSSLLLTGSLWCWLTGFNRGLTFSLSSTPPELSLGTSQSLLTNKMLPESQLLDDPMDFRLQFRKWWVGELSNFDYLLLLNKLAGRRWGDRFFHTVMPWVIDFSVKPGIEEVGWRNLSNSKWRLAKGDEQLDFTFSTAEIPHHVSDECLSELAVCIYKARRLPLKVLRRVVRSVYEPNEYPASMQRLYQWTPDECIPEFYSDACVFESIHPGMSNLSVPDWAKDPKEFVALHRAALESERVSSQLHHWIDLTFGYQLSGEAAIASKNVPLSTTGPRVPRSIGRRQLFVQPHPRRSTRCNFNHSSSLKEQKADRILEDRDLKINPAMKEKKTMSHKKKFLHSSGRDRVINGSDKSDQINFLLPLEELEQSGLFCEQGRHLSPCYKVTKSPGSMDLNSFHTETKSVAGPTFHGSSENALQNTKTHLYGLKLESLQKPLESFRVENNEEISIEDFLSWKIEASKEKTTIQDFSNDIFAAGCIIAELYMQRPLFDLISASAYATNGSLPRSLDLLPSHARLLVETTLQESSRRPTAQMLLDSPFFPASIRLVYDFLSTLECFSTTQERWEYVAQKSQEGAFQSMGSTAAEICAASCFSLITPPYECLDSGAIIDFLQSMLQSMKPNASKWLLVPVVQRLLQSHESGQLKLALLQSSFMRSLQKALGTSVYIQQIHAYILGNVLGSENGSHGSAASVVLVEMCLELGLPVTLHQIVVPLLQTFGRDITVHGIETLVEVGVQYGEKVVLKHLLPPLRSILMPSEVSGIEVTGPAQSWRLMAMVDALAVLDRIVLILRPATVITELLQEPNNVYVKILQRTDLHPSLLECAAKAVLALCTYVGPDATSTFVLPQLKQLFDEVAFAGALEVGNASTQAKATSSTLFLDSQDGIEPPLVAEMLNLSSTNKPHNNGSISYGLSLEKKTEDRMNLVHVLYPSLASIMGIEKLRRCLTTWLLLEQCLLKHYGWKWEAIDAVEVKSKERVQSLKGSLADPVFDLTSANMLLNGVGWSIPQSLAQKWSKVSNCHNQSEEATERRHASEMSVVNNGAWSWVPVVNDNWGTTEAFTRIGATMGIGKDDPPWKLNAVMMHSWKAQNGSLKAATVDDSECEIYTAGGGSRNRSTVRRWKLSSVECNFEYMGHEEPVHDICILRGWERVASCDGTLHIWSSTTGERVAMFGESGASLPSRSTSASSNVDGDKFFGNGYNALGAGSSNGILSAGWAGNLYTYIHYLETDARLLVGTTNGSIRFIDITEGRRLFSWRCEPVEVPLPSYVSAICSTGGEESQDKKHLASPWIAAGFSSGHCSLLDYRSGSVLSHWRAHGAAITKMGVLDDHYILSSSVDKTLRLWDLRRYVFLLAKFVPANEHFEGCGV
ncbi:hypothetical protein O6H91_03G016900 [Diphasiastrum complanatum]|uniref:Uncharacterized protein n=3 Tax=Diphasiastrum complanatum TaxID=34168 RepID=A0ACC2E3R8_DIPCM|nr:hypothetical protein O6H91_03G016900 [Diphasiastrum complanatum]KAJ7561166.1 hypothetical protein O6H91_03G016900 [Diphasiastrum complanatum]KAJ7561169.1 hypothetical protein O6H91_03G016900 [Diphasiastrum complanatum]